MSDEQDCKGLYVQIAGELSEADMKTTTVTDSDGTFRVWENGTFGESLEYAQLSHTSYSLKVDEAASLQMISIRLDKSLIEDLKSMASRKGIEYQPLIRKILDHFVYKEPEEFLQAINKLGKEKPDFTINHTNDGLNGPFIYPEYGPLTVEINQDKKKIND